MKTVKYGMLALILAMASGCGNGIRARNEIQKEYVDSEIQIIPGNNFRFLVRKPDGSIWFVECEYLSTDKISNQCQIFTAKK